MANNGFLAEVYFPNFISVLSKNILLFCKSTQNPVHMNKKGKLC